MSQQTQQNLIGLWSGTYLLESAQWDISQLPALSICWYHTPGCELPRLKYLQRFFWMGKLNPMFSTRLYSCVVLRVDAPVGQFTQSWFGQESQPPTLHHSPLLSPTSFPVFPPSHQVLFIDSEIAEEEMEGGRWIKNLTYEHSPSLPSVSLVFFSFSLLLTLSLPELLSEQVLTTPNVNESYTTDIRAYSYSI